MAIVESDEIHTFGVLMEAQLLLHEVYWNIWVDESRYAMIMHILDLQETMQSEKGLTKNNTQNHVEKRWCTTWMLATRCNLTSFLPRFSSKYCKCPQTKDMGVFLDFRDLFLWEKMVIFFSPPQGWSSSMAFESGLIHIHPTCPLSNRLGRWASSSVHGTLDHSLVDLPVNHQWLYHCFFSVSYFLKSLKNCSVFLYFSLVDDFLTPPKN